jgi:hypothetical protein
MKRFPADENGLVDFCLIYCYGKKPVRPEKDKSGVKKHSFNIRLCIWKDVSAVLKFLDFKDRLIMTWYIFINLQIKVFHACYMISLHTPRLITGIGALKSSEE